MGFKVKENSSEKELIPSGVHHAVCTIVADMGSVINKTYGSAQRKVLIGWEIPDIRVKYEKDGNKFDLPKMAYKKYTASLSDKAYLKKDLEGWRGKAFSDQEKHGFDMSVLIGHSCQLNIIHEVYNGQTYANIAGIFPPIKGSIKLVPEGQTVSYSIDDDRDNIPLAMPEWIEKIIRESPEFQALNDNVDDSDPDLSQYESCPPDDSIPF